MSTSIQQRQDYVAAARQLVAEACPNITPWGNCLYSTAAFLIVTRNSNVRFIPQAGTMMWPRVQRHQDDGVSPTHFSYVWSPNEHKSIMAQAMGHLPEMHVWAADPASCEIIDISTKYFPLACKNLIGYDWPGLQPPDFIWASEVPKDVIYSPSREATQLAVDCMTKTVIPLLMRCLNDEQRRHS